MPAAGANDEKWAAGYSLAIQISGSNRAKTMISTATTVATVHTKPR